MLGPDSGLGPDVARRERPAVGVAFVGIEIHRDEKAPCPLRVRITVDECIVRRTVTRDTQVRELVH